MQKIYSIDLMIRNEHSADAIYQECLYNSFLNDFQLVSTSSYKSNAFYCDSALAPILNKSIFNKLFCLFRNGFIIFNKLRKDKNSILIFQSFFASEIIITLLVVAFHRISLNRNFFKIVLIMRFEFSQIQLKIFPLFLKMLPKNYNLVFFTDTNELKIIHERNVKKDVTILPIPHTFQCNCIDNESPFLYIGFPGFPRKEKGFELIEKIIENCYFENIIFNLQDWHIYKSSFAGKKNIDLNFYTQTRQNYMDYICACDIVILPYANSNYLNRSSGIFAESITTNKIVLVSNGTWMSNQLKLMKLENFVINDFSDLNEVRNKILYIKNNFSDVKKEFALKTISFSRFHNQNSFTKIFLDRISN
jgi:hypothetical protein